MTKSNNAKTLEEIADKCGVSLSTVSRVLNNKPGISNDTRQKVLKTADEYNFTLQKRKRPLTRSELNLVIVVPEETELSVNPFLNISELLRAINEAFKDEKIRIEVVSISDFDDYIVEDVTNVDGVLLAYRGIPDYMREKFQSLDIPYIFLSRMYSNDNYVSCNCYKGILQLGEMLISEGHTKIGYFGNGGNPNNIDRFRGYITALSEAGISFEENMVLNAESIFDVDKGKAVAFISGGCNAVICFNDYMAIRLMNELLDLGKKIPDEISITGFDDSPLRNIFKPLLTTIQQPTYEMGFLASRWLRDNIMNQTNRSLRVEVDGKLLQGASVRVNP